jgi:ATP-dependent Clp protease ATP-binding subunit ClpC
MTSPPPGAPLSDALAMRVIALLRRLPSGRCTVAPINAPQLTAYGPDGVATADLRLFLSEHLALLPAEQVARFAVSERARLEEVDVLLPREDLPRRIQIDTPLRVPCVVVPDGKHAWVIVVPLRHTFYLRDDESLDESVRAEVTRLVGAMELPPEEYLRLLPARAEHLLTLDVDVVRPERTPADKALSRLKAARDRLRRQEAQDLLDTVAMPLHGKSSRRSAPLHGRDDALKRLASLMEGPRRLSVLLQGPTLAGKSALARRWLAERLARDPEARAWRVSGAQLIAGMSGFGQWEERVRRVMLAAETLDAVLYFDNLGDLFSDRATGHVDIPNALRPYLDEGRVRVLGELRADLLDSAERRNGAFLACFSRVTVDPLSADASAAALRAHLPFGAREGRAALRDDAVLTLVDLAERYLPYQAFPGKLFKLYESLRTLHENTRAPGRDGVIPAITPEDAQEHFSVQSGVPAFLLRDDRALALDDVVRALRQRVIGQDEAVRRVAEVVCVVKARLQPAGRPLATLLFVGPTGVGKTELARGLAQLLFGHEDKLLRFDMSEYTDLEAADRLIRGVDGGDGLLTRRVRESPFCVLLLDEVETAHPAVFDLLLQVCGEARLTDARGRTAYFHNALIILTSNLGATGFRESAGFGGSTPDATAHYTREVDRTFRPEFVNRLDRVVAFQPLDRAQLREVASIALTRLRARRGLGGRDVLLHLSDAALDALVHDAWSPRYGARALRRHLEDALVAPLARALATLPPGLCAIHVLAAQEDIIPFEGAFVAGDHLHGALRVRLFARRATTLGHTQSASARVGALRRFADGALRLPRVIALREQLDYLVASLDHGRAAGDDAAAATEVATLQTEHHHLATVWNALETHRAALHDVEELMTLATFERGAADDLLDEALAADARYRTALARALLAAEPRRDAITLMVAEIDSRRALDRWLGALLDALEPRGWSAVFHLHGSVHRREGDDWPEFLPWCAPRDAAWMRAKLDEETRDFSYVVVRVRGPWCGALLALEAGLVVLSPVAHAHEEDCGHLWVRTLGLTDVVPERAWRDAMMVPPPSTTWPQVRRSTPARCAVDTSETVELPGGGEAKVPVEQWFVSAEALCLPHLLWFEGDPRAPEREALFDGPLHHLRG